MMKELEKLNQQVRICKRCPLALSRTNAVPGEGPIDARLMLIGEAPGRSEDQQGRPFCGSAGRILDRALAEAGIKRDDVFITNVVKCRPPNNRKPLAYEVKSCLPYLIEQINIVKPKVIIALGSVARDAIKSLYVSTEGSLKIGTATVLQTYHPAATLHGNKNAFGHIVSELKKAAEATNLGSW